MLQRIGAAFLAGFLLGLERESRGRAAGLRTTILVCMAATFAMILSEIYYLNHTEANGQGVGWSPDPARLGAGILTGMGFIGAGVIVRQGQMVQGVTTAALMWFVTVIGFCFGSGQMALGTAGFVIAAVALYGLQHLDAWMQNERIFVLVVTLDPRGPEVDTLLARLTSDGLNPRLTGVSVDSAASTRTVTTSVRFKGRAALTPPQCVDRLASLSGVQYVELK